MSIGEHPHSIYNDLYGEKLIVSVTYENERISIKKTAYLVCYVSRVWFMGKFVVVYGFYCKRSSLCI